MCAIVVTVSKGTIMKK